MPNYKSNKNKKKSKLSNKHKQAGDYTSNKKTNPKPTTSKEADKPDENSSISNASLDQWLQNNVDNYATKSREMLADILNSGNDVAKTYKDLTSFVHDSLAEFRKLIDIRRDSSNTEEKLAKVECSQMRHDKIIQYLTTPFKRWWMMPGGLDEPRTYKWQEPWEGSQDKRTACQFVEEFIRMVLPYCWCTNGAIFEFIVRLRSDKSKEIDEFVDSVSCKGTYLEDVVKKFINTFATDSVHCKEIADFDTACPNYQEIFSFVQYWLGRFRFNPKVHPGWVIDKLIVKLPHRYVSSLSSLKLNRNSEVSYTTISEVIYNRAAELGESIPDARDYLGYHKYPNSDWLQNIKRDYNVEVKFATDEMDTTPSDEEDEEEEEEDEFEEHYYNLMFKY